MFLKNKIDDTYLINLEKYIKNEKIYDINDFYYNLTIKFDSIFSDIEKNEILYIKKFVELSLHLYLLTSIPKETFNKPFISICSPVYM